MDELDCIAYEEFADVYIGCPDGFTPDPTDDGVHCRGNGFGDIECQCEGCECAFECYSDIDDFILLI